VPPAARQERLRQARNMVFMAGEGGGVAAR
jgi:hypothetical protein